MSIDAVSNYSIGLQQTPKASLKSQQSFTSKPEVDEEKSNATKYMIGATALAAVIGLGIAGYKGKLGKGIQEFLGGAEKAVKDGAQNASESAGSVSKPLSEGTEPVGSKASDALVDGVENGVVATPKSEVINEKPLNETSGLKPELEAEPKTNPKTEPNTKAELEARAKAEEKAFIEKYKQAIIDKLYGEGEELYRTAVKKYDGLVKRFAHQRTKFDQIAGQRSEKHGLFIIEQKLGKGAKNTETTMTYYSKDGKNIDKVVCTRGGKKAYQVTYRDNGETVELCKKDLFIDGGKDGIAEIRSRNNHVLLSVYNDETQMEIGRQDYSNGELKLLGIQYNKRSGEKTVNADKESICDYLNITD